MKWSTCSFVLRYLSAAATRLVDRECYLMVKLYQEPRDRDNARHRMRDLYIYYMVSAFDNNAPEHREQASMLSPTTSLEIEVAVVITSVVCTKIIHPTVQTTDF